MAELMIKAKNVIKIHFANFLFIWFLRILIFLRFDFRFIFSKFISGKLVSPSHLDNPVRNRVPTFEFIIEELCSRDNLLVLETGSMRADHNKLSWGDDGCSTLLFNLLTSASKGSCISVDISSEAVKHARKYCFGQSEIHLGDSVDFLRNFDSADKIDLLYLDSYDFDPRNPHPSQMHHLNEIEVIFDRLKSGAYVLVDDADILFDGSLFGKASLLINFFAKRNISPKITGYQVLFQVP
jgi:hypothetical protein